jgi:hypothetical protein
VARAVTSDTPPWQVGRLRNEYLAGRDENRAFRAQGLSSFTAAPYLDVAGNIVGGLIPAALGVGLTQQAFPSLTAMAQRAVTPGIGALPTTRIAGALAGAAQTAPTAFLFGYGAGEEGPVEDIGSGLLGAGAAMLFGTPLAARGQGAQLRGGLAAQEQLGTVATTRKAVLEAEAAQFHPVTAEAQQRAALANAEVAQATAGPRIAAAELRPAQEAANTRYYTTRADEAQLRMDERLGTAPLRTERERIQTEVARARVEDLPAVRQSAAQRRTAAFAREADRQQAVIDREILTRARIAELPEAQRARALQRAAAADREAERLAGAPQRAVQAESATAAAAQRQELLPLNAQITEDRAFLLHLKRLAAEERQAGNAGTSAVEAKARAFWAARGETPAAVDAMIERSRRTIGSPLYSPTGTGATVQAPIEAPAPRAPQAPSTQRTTTPAPVSAEAPAAPAVRPQAEAARNAYNAAAAAYGEGSPEAIAAGRRAAGMVSNAAPPVAENASMRMMELGQGPPTDEAVREVSLLIRGLSPRQRVNAVNALKGFPAWRARLEGQ